MTFYVVETSTGRRELLREIKASVLVFPGAGVQRGNVSQPDRPLQLADLDAIVSAMRTQVALIYHGFSAHVPARRGTPRHDVRYRFHIGVARTENAAPVPFSEPTAAGYRALEVGNSGRSHASALQEARERSFTNIAVVYPWIRGNTCAPRFEAGGSASRITASRRHPDVLDPVSNTVVVAGHTVVAPGNQTFAHEVGHLLGMADRRYQGREIMSQAAAGETRLLTPADQFRLHNSVEYARSGRLGRVGSLGQIAI